MVSAPRVGLIIVAQRTMRTAGVPKTLDEAIVEVASEAISK